jgi:hypothetical protein
MCPICLTTVGLIVAGSVSTGGLAVKLSRKKNNAREINPNLNERSTQDVNEHDREPENSVARCAQSREASLI